MGYKVFSEEAQCFFRKHKKIWRFNTNKSTYEQKYFLYKQSHLKWLIQVDRWKADFKHKG